MVIQSKKVWLADQFVPAAIEVNDGRITAILPYGTKDVDDDYGDKRIVPGFMDIHCHGAYEFDTNDANEDGLRYWAEHIVSEGVTSFLATTITQSVEVLTNAVTNVANVMENGYDGAEILGIHFEGPYLDMKYKGAQPDQYIVNPPSSSSSTTRRRPGATSAMSRWPLSTMRTLPSPAIWPPTAWWSASATAAPPTSRPSWPMPTAHAP